ncbi:multiple coagulation factor deficiency protein 2 homolog isoform X2 [Argiope bruennichi]|nr:multiple coagulation factor deficiency protein 2 homolog isoform X2 [Argiope bruennichi]XP_055945878.1 multiple coagulation factor deficiency protein 2 homolog isoform X2 [Argiope bruennichi]
MEFFTRIVFCVSMLLAMCDVMTGHEGRHKGHSHHLPQKDGPKNVLKDKKYLRDYDHLKEDLEDMYMKDFSGDLSEAELENYYFQLHDLNGDKQLDGLELLAAMNHVMDRENEFTQKDIEENPHIRQSIQAWWNDKFQEDALYIDEILQEEDIDNDGYLSYIEFALGRAKERGEI